MENEGSKCGCCECRASSIRYKKKNEITTNDYITCSIFMVIVVLIVMLL